MTVSTGSGLFFENFCRRRDKSLVLLWWFYDGDFDDWGWTAVGGAASAAGVALTESSSAAKPAPLGDKPSHEDRPV